MPNAATGEFASLAAIAGSDETGEWSIRGLRDERRVRQFCGADALSAAHDFLARVGMTIDLDDWVLEDEDVEAIDDALATDRAPVVSEDWLSDLARRNRHVVQLSNPAPILASTVDEALDLVFAHVTVEPAGRPRRHLTKWRLISDMNLRYLEAGIEPGANFSRGAELSAGGPKGYRHPIDYIVSGKQALQVVQLWSFQVESQRELSRDVKAWGWTMRELLLHGGSAVTKTHTVQVPVGVDAWVVVAPPEQDQPTSVYQEALSVFEELSVQVIEHGDEESVARMAVELLGKS